MQSTIPRQRLATVAVVVAGILIGCECIQYFLDGGWFVGREASQQSGVLHHHHHPIPNKKITSRTSTMFPSLADTLEMATLSSLIYAFHREDYGNDDVNNTVCDRINLNVQTGKNGDRSSQDSRPIPSNITCEWYHHDWTGGSQVMIVSSVVKNYVAVIFAGTDDLRTSLTDVNILTTSFGASSTASSSSVQTTTRSLIRDDPALDDSAIGLLDYPIYNVSLPDAPLAQVHSGFNHAVFDRNLFGEIVARVEAIRCVGKNTRLFTAGHSLGAANAILTSVGLVQYYEQVRSGQVVPLLCNCSSSTSLVPDPPDHLVSLNFGCPQTGNTAWREYIHTHPTMLRRLFIWRFVLGWDLVPRLPEFFQHVGHTVQLTNFHQITNESALAYYQHLGNASLQLAGVPFGWSEKPFLWVPGALDSHYMIRYWAFLTEWSQQINSTNKNDNGKDKWPNSFEPVPNVLPPDDDHSNRPPDVDDDFYVDPPDDDAAAAFLRRQQAIDVS